MIPTAQDASAPREHRYTQFIPQKLEALTREDARQIFDKHSALSLDLSVSKVLSQLLRWNVEVAVLARDWNAHYQLQPSKTRELVEGMHIFAPYCRDPSEMTWGMVPVLDLQKHTFSGKFKKACHGDPDLLVFCVTTNSKSRFVMEWRPTCPARVSELGQWTLFIRAFNGHGEEVASAMNLHAGYTDALSLDHPEAFPPFLVHATTQNKLLQIKLENALKAMGRSHIHTVDRLPDSLGGTDHTQSLHSMATWLFLDIPLLLHDGYDIVRAKNACCLIAHPTGASIDFKRHVFAAVNKMTYYDFVTDSYCSNQSVIDVLDDYHRMILSHNDKFKPHSDPSLPPGTDPLNIADETFNKTNTAYHFGVPSTPKDMLEEMEKEVHLVLQF